MMPRPALTTALRPALALALLSSLAGCAELAGVVALGGVAGSVVGARTLPDSLVTVRFATPVDLVVLRPTPRGDRLGDTLRVREVHAVVGRMPSRLGDTLRLEVVEVSSVRERHTFRRGTAATSVLLPSSVVTDSVGVRKERWLGASIGALLTLGILVGMIAS